MGRVAHSTTYFYNLPVCFCHCLLHQWGWFYSEKRAYTCGVSSRDKNHIDTKDDKEDRWCQFLSRSATSRIMTAYKKNKYISRFVTVICPGYYCTTFFKKPPSPSEVHYMTVTVSLFSNFSYVATSVVYHVLHFFCQAKFVKNKRQKRCYNSHSSGLQ